MGKKQKRNRSDEKAIAALVIVTAVLNLINSIIELIRALR